ncbi:hypothetical protein [Aquabacterium sp. CECT 9606]|uniref:hypothetical protein n=1 Tax=Aquabacterium sp. CECT 9606 TaxID=2845822 RepID=UPI001E5A55E1|nr:hypothetical protein [Aquabacterium sp. CECT 9606]
MKKLILSLFVLSISGCAVYKPVPENYTGPIATVTDSGRSEDSTKAQIFALTEIDGHNIRSSFQTSRIASQNQGPILYLSLTKRQVPAVPMKVKIRGSHATGAPIHELASRAVGTFHEVEGTVDFTPEPNGNYMVVGTLSKESSSVWIEDANSHQPVTEKVASK